MLKTPVLTAPSSTHWSQLLEEIYQKREVFEYGKGVKIPLYPHEVCVVCRGIVQLSTLQYEGNESILGLAFPEMPFGLPFTQIFPYEATALTDVVLMRVSPKDQEQSPMLAQGIQMQLNHRLQQAEALFALVRHRYVSVRVQELMLLLIEEMGEHISGGTRLGFRLTHQQIADLVGSSRVSITRLLKELQKSGWLSIDKTRHFVVHNSVVLDSSPLVYESLAFPSLPSSTDQKP